MHPIHCQSRESRSCLHLEALHASNPFNLCGYEKNLPTSEIIYMAGTIQEHLGLNVFNGLLQDVEKDLGELSTHPALSN
jgi:hypothetical protein